MLAIPLRMVQISPHVAVCATRIVTIMSTNYYQARRCIKEEKDAGRLINACGRGKAKSAIFLDNGAVIASPVTVKTLVNRMALIDDEATERKSTQSQFAKIYDYEKPTNPLDLIPPPPMFEEGLTEDENLPEDAYEEEDDEDEDDEDYDEDDEDDDE